MDGVAKFALEDTYEIWEDLGERKADGNCF